MRLITKKLTATAFVSALSLGVVACGDDVVDDGVQNEAEDLGNEMEGEVEERTE